MFNPFSASGGYPASTVGLTNCLRNGMMTRNPDLMIFSFSFRPKARDTVHGSRQDGLGQLVCSAGWLHPHTGTHLIRRYFRTVSQRGRIPPFPLSCSSSTISMTSSEYFSFSYPCLSIWAQIFLC